MICQSARPLNLPHRPNVFFPLSFFRYDYSDMHTDLDAQTQKSGLQKPALLLLRRNLANKKYNLIASFHGLLNGYSVKLIYNMFLVTQSQTNTCQLCFTLRGHASSVAIMFIAFDRYQIALIHKLSHH